MKNKQTGNLSRWVIKSKQSRIILTVDLSSIYKNVYFVWEIRYTQSLSVCMCARWLQLFLTLCDPMGFSQQDYWSGLPCPFPGDLPNPGI